MAFDKTRFGGVVAPIVNPCGEDDSLDRGALEANLTRLLATDVAGLYINGGTGDAANLTQDERLETAALLVPRLLAAGKLAIVHVGQTNQRQAVELARQAAALGAHAVASIPPKKPWPQIVEYYKTLAAAGKEVIAVDKDEAKVKAVRGYTDYAFVIDELNETSLKETGMQNCGTVTICIGEQIDISILTTMLVTKLGVPHVISKAASEVHGEVLKRLGAEVVYPEADMAVRIGKRLISGNLLDYIALGDGVEVRRITVGGRMLGKSVRALDLRKVYGINIIAVEHGQQTNVEFSADYTFKEGDAVAVIGKFGKIDKFEKEM